MFYTVYNITKVQKKRVFQRVLSFGIRSFFPFVVPQL